MINKLERILQTEVSSFQWLKRHRRKINRCRDSYYELHPDEQIQLAKDCIIQATGSPDLADTLLKYQIGEQYNLPLDEILNDTPARAHERITQAARQSAEPLWTWTLFQQGENNMLNIAQEYLEVHDVFSQWFGLYPNPPSIENVQFQRTIPRNIRSLAASIRHMLSIQLHKDIQTGAAPLLIYLHNAAHTYSQYEPDYLQQVLRLKIASDDKFRDLEKAGLCDDVTDIVAMLIDAGPRDELIRLSRMHEQISIPQVLGYNQTQPALAQGSLIRSLYRAA